MTHTEKHTQKDKVPYHMVLFAAAVMTVLLFFLFLCTEGIKKGMGYTVRIIVPSLFPYMVLSSFIVRSGTDIIIGRISVPLTKLLALPESAGAAVLLSLTGGFPVGAKCVSLLYEEGRLNKEQADRMMCFCVCPGPAFLIPALGCIMLGNIQGLETKSINNWLETGSEYELQTVFEQYRDYLLKRLSEANNNLQTAYERL